MNVSESVSSQEFEHPSPRGSASNISYPAILGQASYIFPVEVWRIILVNFEQPLRCASVSKLFLNEIVFQSVTSIQALLKKQVFETTQFLDINDEYILRFKFLKELTLSPFVNTINKLTDECIGGLINLTSLDISSNNFIDKLRIETLKKLTNLTYLNINSFDMTDDEARELTYLTNLSSLYLGSNKTITARGLSALTQLNCLNINYNGRINDEGIMSLTNLTDIDIACTSLITDQGIKNLTKLVALETNPFISNEGICNLINLETLIIRYNNRITNTGSLSHITYLNMRSSYSLDDQALIRLAHSLKKLDLSYNELITDNAVSVLTNLSSLYLCDNTIITDLGIESLTNLTFLELDQCLKVTDNGLKNLTNIESLSLYTNYFITDDGIRNLTKLTFLYLSRNRNITFNGISGLVNLSELALGGSIIFDFFMDSEKDFFEVMCSTFPLLDRKNISEYFEDFHTYVRVRMQKVSQDDDSD